MNNINIISPNTYLWELADILSVRSLTISHDANFKTVKDVVNYYLQNRTFKKLRNCGAKTEKELTELCESILIMHGELIIEYNQGLQSIYVETHPYLKLSTISLTILTTYVENNLFKLESRNVRAKNIIEKLWIESNKNFILFYDYLKEIDFNYNQLEFAGKSTIPLIEEFIALILLKADNLIRLQINNIEKNDDSSIFLSYERTKINLERIFVVERKSVGIKIFERYEKEFLNREFPLLVFIEDLLNSYVIFNERKTEIFKHQYHYFTNLTPNSLEELSELHNITRERVRQLSVTLVYDFWEEIEKIAKCIDLNYAKQYVRITQDRPFMSLNEYDLDSLRTNYIDGFNLAFTHKLISIFDPNYMLLNDDGIRSSARKSKVFSGNNNFLIKNEIIVNFRLDDFFEDFHTLINDEIDEEFLLPIEGYISSYFIDKKDLRYLQILRKFIEEVALKEFNVITDFEENLIIPRNTRMSVADYVYEALKGLNKPSHISEIFEWITNELPHLNIGQKSLGTSTLRDERIIFFGRSSTYGLKDWESLGTYKGGTIRSIVEEYLEKFEEPKHVFEMLGYVLKYRPDTNIKSLESNLKLAVDSEILSFGNGFWGLKNKPVPENFKIVGIPTQITRMLKSFYFCNSNEIAYQTLLENLMSQYKITSVQAQYYIQTKIEHGTLGLDKENGIITLIEC